MHNFTINFPVRTEKEMPFQGNGYPEKPKYFPVKLRSTYMNRCLGITA